MPGAADSWYHEKESAWLYRAAAEPEPSRRALFEKLAAAAEDQANHWRRVDSRITANFSPALRAWVVAGLLRRMRAPVVTVSPRRSCAVMCVYSSALACLILSLFTGHSGLRGGLRLVVIGGGAGLAALGVGKCLVRDSPDARGRHCRAFGQRQDHTDRRADTRGPGRGLSVSTIKHTHHHEIELDSLARTVTGTALAGASEVIIASDSGWARIAASAEPASLQELSRASFGPWTWCWSKDSSNSKALRRVEVFRGTDAPLARQDPGIAAVAVPEALALDGLRREETAAR